MARRPKRPVIKQHKKQTARRKRRHSRFPAFLRRQAVIPAIILIMGLAGNAYFGLQMSKVETLGAAETFSVATPPPPPIPEPPKSLPRSEPTQLRIASVGIDIGVISVGKNPDDSMELPPLFERVAGWYKYSPTPGEIGPAVIAGHVDTYRGPSVFWRLREVKPGDIVELTRADGTIATFKVEALKQFAQDQFPTEEVYGNIDHSGLRLITCGGTFNRQTGHYTENTVVFATIVI